MHIIAPPFICYFIHVVTKPDCKALLNLKREFPSSFREEAYIAPPSFDAEQFINELFSAL